MTNSQSNPNVLNPNWGLGFGSFIGHWGLGIGHFKKGFTIIEVLGAIFILSIGVLASYTVAQKALSQTFSSAARLTAAYLAEEGIEIIRNIRDSNWVANNSWNTGLNPGTYQISYDSYSLSAYADTYVNYAAGTNNKFKRKITLANQTDGSIKVTTDVIWQENGAPKTVTVQSYLYDWK